MKKFVLRIWHFLQRIGLGFKSFPTDLHEFGFYIALLSFLDVVIPPGKSQKYIDAVEVYVAEYLKPLVQEYLEEDYIPPAGMETSFEEVPVWCCWWQGTENMPEIVKMCNNRLKKILPSEAKLQMLTQGNYREYIDLPEYILRKLDEGKMSVTAFTDVLRTALLSEYGGLWIDSTVLISGEFPMDFISHSFYTQRMYDPEKWNREACKGRWCGFMMSGSKNNIIFRFLRDAFYQWWKDYDKVIDYVILDYFLLAAYHSIPVVKQMVDQMPDNNTGVFEMYRVLNKPYSKELLERLTETTNMHKLTYKINLLKETAEGEQTLYAYLLDCVNKDREFI